MHGVECSVNQRYYSNHCCWWYTGIAFAGLDCLISLCWLEASNFSSFFFFMDGRGFDFIMGKWSNFFCHSRFLNTAITVTSCHRLGFFLFTIFYLFISFIKLVKCA